MTAVRYHTTGRAGMSLLEKVLFIADFTSADRDYKDVDVMRRLADEDLSAAMPVCVELYHPGSGEKTGGDPSRYPGRL